MTKYIVTGKKFDGCIELYYNEKARLCKLVIDTELSVEQFTALMQKVPQTTAALPAFEKIGSLKIVEEVIPVTFEDFYNEFGNKVGKLKAETAWKRLTHADQVKAYLYIGRYKSWLKMNPGVAQLHPVTFLNQKRWED